MQDTATLEELTRRAWEIRLELLKMFSHGKAHHFGGSLSCAELVAALYFYKMNYSVANMADLARDRFIMSKGHSVPAQYAALAMLGVIPREELASIKRLGSRLQGHPDVAKTPGLEAPTGSLGQGLSYANGIALAGRMDGLRFNVYVIVGDGELQEGQVWEAAMTTAHYGLTNVCLMVDRNCYQSQGACDDLMGVEPLADKWQAFGWQAVRIDGHDMGQVCSALDLVNDRNERPLALIADTVKGKGVSFMEGGFKHHNASLSVEEYALAVGEIEAKIAELDRE